MEFRLGIGKHVGMESTLQVGGEDRTRNIKRITLDLEAGSEEARVTVYELSGPVTYDFGLKQPIVQVWEGVVTLAEATTLVGEFSTEVDKRRYRYTTKAGD